MERISCDFKTSHTYRTLLGLNFCVTKLTTISHTVDTAMVPSTASHISVEKGSSAVIQEDRGSGFGAIQVTPVREIGLERARYSDS